MAKKKNKKMLSNADDNVLEILLGTLIISINDFNGGIFFEKILVLSGLFILIVGIIRSIMKYKAQDRKVMIIIFGLMGVMFGVVFLGLLYRLIFA